MAELEPTTPKSVVDFNERLVKLLKEADTKDFIQIVSHPDTLARLAADQQQQQQQQQVKRQ